ncbi:MAG: ABC transporter permease [Candidatus Hodarchaeales archaeon]|jgi:ABC-type dipeptide/oligopeptide/nickel transport system permease component
MKLRDYVIKRIILLIPIMFGVTLFAYVLAHEIGDPIAAYIGQDSKELSQLQKDRYREQLGLNKPILDRYLLYLERLLQGDWGTSTTESPHQPVLQVIAHRFPATAELSMIALSMAILLGIPFGIISAVRKDKLADHATRLMALSGVSIPVFWLGLMIQIIIHNVNLANDVIYDIPIHFRYDETLYNHIPVTGFLFIDSLLALDFPLFIDAIVHVIPPAFVLGWVSMALIARMTRMAMIETMKQDYILLAKSKGLTERVIIYRHALRNAIIPTLTIAGLALAGLLTGSVLTETVFDWPGLGKWAVDAMNNIDLAAIMGFTIILSVVYVLSNLLVDILYAFVDPRITLD